MHEFIAILSFVLSLFGWHFGGTTYSNRLHDGGTVLHSEAWADAGAARFECVQSSSGQCYYRLLPETCAQDCTAAPLREFALEEGGTLAFTGLPAFRIDVSTSAQR